MKSRFGRRSFLTSAAGVAGASFWADQTIEAYQQSVQTASKPSELRITDVRMAMARVGGDFLVLENHSVDVPTWGDIVDGVEKPIINKGFITVPSGPGLGFKLNEEALKKALREPGYFEPTPQWDNKERINDRLWS
jgi:hypothetical protein